MKTRICFLLTFLFLAGAFAEESPDPSRDPVVVAVQKVLPAVVNISTERMVQRQFGDPFEDFWRQFFGETRRPQREGSQSLGSGVIVDEDGWIVSNWHVVRRATRIHAVLSDGSRYEAQYVSGDEQNDLALLRIEAKKALPYVEIATASEPLLGETVIAVGNPFGLEHTVTKGIISAKNRRYDARESVFEDILQTDAAINPGNSGGPLINTRGQLVGINMAILSQAEGIGFAIPAKRVAALLAKWFSPEKRAHVWLGARFIREAERIVVVEVQTDSPAAKAGLRERDRVVALDGENVNDVLRMLRRLIRMKPGESVQFEIERDGRSRAIRVKLGALPQVSATELMSKRFGIQTQVFTRELAEALGISFTTGLLVVEVEQGSPGSEAGFRRGLVITHVGGEEFVSLDRLAEQLSDINTGDTVTMAVLISDRRGGFLFQQTKSVSLKAR